MVLSIRKEKGRVFSIEIHEKKITVSASNLAGQVLRFMQMPRRPDFWTDIKDTVSKLSSADVINYGAALISDESIGIPSGLFSFPVIILPEAAAEAEAELYHSRDALSSALFISWSEHISAAYTAGDGLHYLPSFAHVRVRKEGRCICGGTGCLEECASVASLKEKSGLDTRSLVTMTLTDPLAAVAFAATEAVQILGVRSVMITGTMSAMKDENYAYLQEMISSKLPPDKSDFIIFRSQCGEAAAREGAGIAALSRFFYSSDLLEKLDSIESGCSCL